MNISSWVGFFIAALVLVFGVFKTLPNPGLFFDSHALLLVCGGTLAAALISVRYKKLEELCSLFFYGLLLKRTKPTLDHARELLLLSALTHNSKSIYIHFDLSHPFAREAFELAKKNYLEEDELKILLIKRNEFFKRSYQSDAKALNNLGKFPPAFGLLGATTGMIAMMTQLGRNQDQIGQAMAIALIATFWGIALANLVLLPLADYAAKVAHEDQVTRQMIAEAIILIRKNYDPHLVGERLCTYLPPDMRRELKEVLRQGPPSDSIFDGIETQIPLRKKFFKRSS